MFIGAANGWKILALNPLTEVLKCFVSPVSGTFAWVGGEKANVIFLNDWRWNDKLVIWTDFLKLLEGLPMHIEAPKTHFAEDILWDVKTPIFATSSTQLKKVDGGVVNEIEANMIRDWWNYFEFCKPVTNPKIIISCGQCLARFILNWAQTFSTVFTYKVFIPYNYSNDLKRTVWTCKQQRFTLTKLTFTS